MINGREVRGAHLITAVDHPESFWTEVERKAGRKLSPIDRRAITTASDAPMTVNWSAEPIRLQRGGTFSSYGYFGGVVNDPVAFTRTHLA